jgi:two-component system, cell cycle response regulator
MSEAGLPRVLIVDDSRIVRSTIAKNIRGSFDIREEADGEAGWETLMVDPAIRVVISDLSMPQLDGYGLLERIRESKVRRVHDMPVIIISGEEDESARQRAKDLGATDFITKGTGTTELLARLSTLVGLADTRETLAVARSEAMTDKGSGLLSSAVLRRQAEQALSYWQRHGGQMSVLIIGFDHLALLSGAKGHAAAEILLGQFARLLASVVRTEDSLARWSDTELAVLTPGIGPDQARAFAERIRQAVARASIRHQARTLQATVSIGVAGFPDDATIDAPSLFAVAGERMLRAQGEGGNRVVCSQAAMALGGSPIVVDRSPAHAVAGNETVRHSKLARLGLSLLPLLHRLDKEFSLGLPLVDMERRLTRAQDESADFNQNTTRGV